MKLSYIIPDDGIWTPELVQVVNDAVPGPDIDSNESAEATGLLPLRTLFNDWSNVQVLLNWLDSTEVKEAIAVHSCS